MPPLYPVADHTLGAILRRGWRPHVQGLPSLPAAGGAILAANHLSIADQLFLGAMVPRPVAFWAKSEYFAHPLPRVLMTGLGAIPVNRAGGADADSAFAAAVPVLAAGGVVAIFPEGTRSPDGRLHRGRTGAVRLARRCAVSVIPVGLIGTGDVRPGDLVRRPRPRVTVRFGRAVDVTRGDVRAATDELMAAIQRLSGQEYVPHYAEKRAG